MPTVYGASDEEKTDLQGELVFVSFPKHASLLRTRAPSAPYSARLCRVNFPGNLAIVRFPEGVTAASSVRVQGAATSGNWLFLMVGRSALHPVSSLNGFAISCGLIAYALWPCHPFRRSLTTHSAMATARSQIERIYQLGADLIGILTRTVLGGLPT